MLYLYMWCMWCMVLLQLGIIGVGGTLLVLTKALVLLLYQQPVQLPLYIYIYSTHTQLYLQWSRITIVWLLDPTIMWGGREIGCSNYCQLHTLAQPMKSLSVCL